MKAPCWFLAEVMVFQQQGKEGLARVLDTLVAVYGGLVAKSCLTLATPWTGARQAPLSGIFQAGILEWIAISFSRGSCRCRN